MAFLFPQVLPHNITSSSWKILHMWFVPTVKYHLHVNSFLCFWFIVFFSSETCDTCLNNASLHFNAFHHFGCDFNTDGEKSTNLIVSILLNILDYYTLKLYFTLPLSLFTTALIHSADSHWHIQCAIFLASAADPQRWVIPTLCSQRVWVLRRKERSKKKKKERKNCITQ